MRGPPDDAADVNRAGQLRMERIGDVVLPHLPGAPAGDVEEPVVERELDVGDERRHRLEVLEAAAAADPVRPARRESR